MRKLMILLVLVSVTQVTAQTVEVPAVAPWAKMVKAAVDESDAFRTDLRSFYGPSGYRPAWTRNGQPTAQANVLLAAFAAAADKGLDPADYSMPPATDDEHFDVALTAAAMRYVSDLHDGRIDPRTVGFELDADSRRLYLPAILTGLSISSNPQAMLASLEPQSADYRGLLAALATYRRLAAESQDELPLPSSAMEKVKPGDVYAALPQLAAKLQRTGDLAADAQVTAYDGAIVDAVKRFQSRHGLAADGVLAAKTVSELNVPASRRVQQIEWAIERSRWTAGDGPSIVVNIPEFRLRATDGADTLTMRVVVGKSNGHKTPVLEGDLRSVVFRPYWGVPANIQRNEIVPKLAKDPGYLARHGYEIVDAAGQSYGTAVDAATIADLRSMRLQLRQKPGRSNALGLVKMIFPNQSDVYLHSTPEQSLFDRTRRDFSHGCVRVEDPVALAAWALKQPADKVKAAMNGTADDQYVRVARPELRVMLVYSTAAIGDNGEVRFFADIYGHDATLAAALRSQHASPAGALLVAAK